MAGRRRSGGGAERARRLAQRAGWKKADKRRKKKTATKKKAGLYSGIYLERATVLRGMGYTSYRAYLDSELWQSVRRKALDRYPICQLCPSREATQVHHQSYDEPTMRGESPFNLLSVCSRCHRRVEFYRNGKKRDPIDVFRMAEKIARRREREDAPEWIVSGQEMDRDLDERLAAITT